MDEVVGSIPTSSTTRKINKLRVTLARFKNQFLYKIGHADFYIEKSELVLMRQQVLRTSIRACTHGRTR